MIWQIVGGVLLLIAAITASGYLRRFAGYRLNALQCAVRIVKHTRRKIDLFDVHISDILADFDDGNQRRGPSVKKDTDFHTGISAVAEYLRGQDREIFLQFAEKLGEGYREDTMKLCEYTLSHLEESQKRAEGEFSARLRLYTALPLLLAGSLFVLFM